MGATKQNAICLFDPNCCEICSAAFCMLLSPSAPSRCLRVYLLTIVCWARRKNKKWKRRWRWRSRSNRRASNSTSSVVLANNEALLSLSLSLSLSLCSLALPCLRLSPLFATGCIAYFSPGSLSPPSILLLLQLAHPLPVSLSASAAFRLAHLHTFTLTCPSLPCASSCGTKSLLLLQGVSMQQAMATLAASSPAS